MLEAVLWRRLVAELLGSAFLAAVVVGSGIAAQQLSPGNVGLELLENAAATAAGLYAIILMFGPVSGAHFNPVVSLVDAAFGGLSWKTSAAYLPAQVAGCLGGAVVANVMFAQSAVSISTHHRATGAHLVSEVVATAGLVLVIFALARTGRSASAPAAVGAYIGAAYFFTSSTSFANPAITIGRMISNTFAGIAPSSAPAFLAAQILGGLAAFAVLKVLYPGVTPAEAADVVVPHLRGPDDPEAVEGRNRPGAGDSRARGPSRCTLVADVHPRVRRKPLRGSHPDLPTNLGQPLRARPPPGPRTTQGAILKDRPIVLFLCIHNSGRSAAARVLLDHYAQGAVEVLSAGSEPGDQINPAVAQILTERGLDPSKEFPKPLTDEIARAADVIVTMGCGDACPVYPGKRYLDWELTDPAGLPVGQVRPIVDDIDRRVQALLAELIPASTSPPVRGVAERSPIMTEPDIRETVRRRYAAAATSASALDYDRARAAEVSCCATTAVSTTDAEGRVVFGADLYDTDAAEGAPEAAVAASLGCGVPTAVADLHPGETVLDLGSGGGADVLISARRVMPGGRAIGLDMTAEMLELARRNAADAGVTNVEFIQGLPRGHPAARRHGRRRHLQLRHQPGRRQGHRPGRSRPRPSPRRPLRRLRRSCRR